MISYKTKSCRNGHELTAETIYIAPKTGGVECRICRKKNYDDFWYGGNREVAIKRDNYMCVRCGLTREQHMEKYAMDITVDHIDGNGCLKPKHLRNNSLDNLQTLCQTCHSKKDIVNNKRTICKLTDEDAEDIRLFARHGLRQVDIHKAYQMVHYTTITDITSGKSHKPVGSFKWKIK